MGKDPMDQEEEDWGGTIGFGFKDKKFSQDIEDYFFPFHIVTLMCRHSYVSSCTCQGYGDQGSRS